MDQDRDSILLIFIGYLKLFYSCIFISFLCICVYLCFLGYFSTDPLVIVYHFMRGLFNLFLIK
jgi:hypothetical protein